MEQTGNRLRYRKVVAAQKTWESTIDPSIIPSSIRSLISMLIATSDVSRGRRQHLCSVQAAQSSNVSQVSRVTSQLSAVEMAVLVKWLVERRCIYHNPRCRVDFPDQLASLSSKYLYEQETLISSIRELFSIQPFIARFHWFVANKLLASDLTTV